MLLTEEETKIKLKANGFKYPVTTWVNAGRRYFRFAYVPHLKDEIKAFEGARWDPDSKCWHVTESRGNAFRLANLAGEPVYARYDGDPSVDGIPTRRYNRKAGKELSYFSHQPKGIAHVLARHHCIIAGEMGTGKTVMAGETLELTGHDWWYVAPRSGVMAVQYDFGVWKFKNEPKFMTYEGLVKEMKGWTSGRKAPFGIVFDEFSRCKNATSQRSQAAMAIANGIRDDWGDDGYIVGMSGTPAPKSPADWYSLVEIIRPGFLREGDIHKFKNRLGIIVQKESIDGGVYPQLVTWRNDSKKCNVCGQIADHEIHVPEMCDPAHHTFVESKNEVAFLAQRLKGLVVVYFKKDCMDLPAKVFEQIICPPSKETLRAAALITRTAKTTIEGLTRLRELSDGFQYIEKLSGTRTCTDCKGTLKIRNITEIPNTCPNCKDNLAVEARESKFDIAATRCLKHVPNTVFEDHDCPTCGGTGQEKTYERTIEEVPCPKDDALVEQLDIYEDVGRIVIFGGFTGTVDRVCRICRHHGWYVIRMDQSKLQITDPKGDTIKHEDFQKMFLEELEEYDKVAFVAHPKSGGMALTLTSSPVAVFFSNDFDGEARMQAPDRIHRPGMDVNRGAKIIDFIHLPSDQKVIENLTLKKDLQSMSLGEFSEGLKLDAVRT